MRIFYLAVGSLLLVQPFSCLQAATPADTAGIEFFETKVRPILVEHCYQCHSASAEKLKGGLFLDTREGLRKGGDTGPAIIEGDPEKSLLIRAVRGADENLQMPPKGKKLTAEQIGSLEAWVKLGAPDPRVENLKGIADDKTTRSREHWAFQPLRDPARPAVKNPDWCQTSIDYFILAELEKANLTPSPRADPAVLIRRASFDLLGLPPTAEEVEKFKKAKSVQAFSDVIEALLGSVHYGERWGRYWLDVARYADTKGYVFEEERRFPYSYTYRDYVVEALNEDLPFDRFLIEQIAADMLPLGDDKRPLAALGFLTLGRRFLNNQPDIIDDRIDVVTRGTMGLTVACARCHDHKFDPIPTRDYYSLYGVFASANEPSEKPLLGSATRPSRYAEFVAEREKREKELEKFRINKTQELLGKLRSQVGDYLLVVHDARQAGDDNKQEKLVRERKLDPTVASRWKSALDGWKKSPHAVFGPWFAWSALPEADFSAKAAELAGHFAKNDQTNELLNPLVANLFKGAAPASLSEVAGRYTKLFADIEKKWRESSAAGETNSAGAGSALAALPDRYEESLRQIIYGPDSPTTLEMEELRRQFDTPTQQKLRALRRQIDELDATHPGAPPRAMALQENSRPYKPHVFIRGNANNPGPDVPRQFLELVAGPDRKPFTNGSGRLELARAIASPKNPLTARVIANRVWMYHFGAPLVRTPSDFGMRSEPPSHPELLDHLASYLIKEKWSLKNLHRLIMASSTYQQSSEHRPAAATVDPENRLLWKMNRRRVDFESMRDTLLAVSGHLDQTVGGRAVDITADPSPPRRTIYGFVERQNLPGLFRTFDFASPDATSPQRFSTTVPQQALFLMNSPFVIQQARLLAARPDVKKLTSVDDRIGRLYEVVYQRTPEVDELELARRFVQTQPTSETAATRRGPWHYGYGAFDSEKERTTNFALLPHFTGDAWQGGAALPDPKLGWVLLSAEGGHVGNDQQHAAIRRWIAPRDGVVGISGEIDHPSAQGDGVRARIVASATGLLGTWTVHHGKAATKVEGITLRRGDTIDFITDCGQNVAFDSFNWAPEIKYRTEQLNYSAGVKVTWKAKEDFAGPPKDQPQPLDAWEQFAQVLLVGNELFFVD